MKHPYDEVYLNDVIEEQGWFFEELQDESSPIDLADLLTAYVVYDKALGNGGFRADTQELRNLVLFS